MADTKTELPTVSLPDVEVFSTGTWNGDAYTASDLDAMVAAFQELKSSWEPAAKAGHEDGQQKDGEMRRLFGVPALGYVERLYRKGSKLVASFKDMPRRFANLVKAGTYKKISAEVYWNYRNPDNGKVYPRVLKAVAFLGADVPAVTNLSEIEALFSKGEDGALYAYDDDKNEFRAYDYRQYNCTMKEDENGKFCVYDSDGKKVGEYDDEEEAQSACDTMNKKGGEMAPKYSRPQTPATPKKEKKDMDDKRGMDESEITALMKKREDELKLQMFKEFEDRIHKAREEGKEEANKENELLREDIRKLQLEKRSERIEHWIKSMKEAGKILPAEESKVRSLRQWLPDEGEALKYFAVKEGQTKEFSAGPAEMFESLFKDRKSLFTTYSRDDEAAEDQGAELPNPGAEVDRRAKMYQEKRAKDNVKVTYREAVSHVLGSSPALAQKYHSETN